MSRARFPIKLELGISEVLSLVTAAEWANLNAPPLHKPYREALRQLRVESKRAYSMYEDARKKARQPKGLV